MMCAYPTIRRRSVYGYTETGMLEEAGDLFNAVTFIVFGAVLIGPALGHVSWTVFGYALLSLTVVRMVPVALSLTGTRARVPTVAFVGWFGPRGLATIVFVILILEEHHRLPHQSLLLTTAVVTIGLSVVAHGLSAAPVAQRYATWYQSDIRAENHPGSEATD
jgi:NhaP-type Na+/H+ or K+/H+ antiporter